MHAELDSGVYQTKIKIDEAHMAAIAMERHDFHWEWNYALRAEPRHVNP